VEICEGAGIALVVLGEAAEARGPSKGSFHHPAARQQDEAALGVRQFDDVQGDAVLLRNLTRLFPGVTSCTRSARVARAEMGSLGRAADPPLRP
jgi:hypothetical protein